tara:strand:+ start:1517 stop:1654 length:138 start_codon:yes stop_codon:yes gene_type:complete
MTIDSTENGVSFLTWDEDNLRWLGKKVSDNSQLRWDADNTQWVSV